MSTRGYRRISPRRGIVLVLVLVVIAMLALVGLALSQWMVAERGAVQVSGQQVQARVLAESGVERARQFAGFSTARQSQMGGSYDNAQWFRDATVLDGRRPQDRGRFSILAPRIRDSSAGAPAQAVGVRYGLEDESARINLLTLLDAESAPGGPRKILMGLPGMTESIADAILDWIDADDELREFGAEAPYYTTLSPGYAPHNGPPGSIDELLLVRGVTRELLYGVAPGPGSQATAGPLGSEAPPAVDNSDGSMSRGWAAYLTLHSAESNLRPDGTPRIDLNQSDLQKLYDQLEKALGPQWATFIVAYRQYGPSGQPGGEAQNAAAPSGKPDLSREASFPLLSVLDLVGSPTRVKYERANTEVTLPCPFPDDPASMKTYLPKLLDNTSVTPAATIPGRININQAPRAVLRCIPGLTAEMIDQIIAKRVPDLSQADPARRYETWIYTEGIVKDLKTMKALMPYVTAGGGVFRVRSVGYFDSGGPAVELEAVIDATRQPVSVLSWKYVPTTRGPVEPK